MRSVEDMLLELILQGDSTYRCASFRHHAAPHCTTPCCTHHHYVAFHHASLAMTLPIIVLNVYYKVSSHFTIVIKLLFITCSQHQATFDHYATLYCCL